MKAFAEWISLRAFIVRVGPQAEKYGDPFDFAVVVVVPWKSWFRWLLGFLHAPVIVKALVAPKKPDGKPSLTSTHSKTALREIKMLGFKPEWERFHNDANLPGRV